MYKLEEQRIDPDKTSEITNAQFSAKELESAKGMLRREGKSKGFLTGSIISTGAVSSLSLVVASYNSMENFPLSVTLMLLSASSGFGTFLYATVFDRDLWLQKLSLLNRGTLLREHHPSLYRAAQDKITDEYVEKKWARIRKKCEDSKLKREKKENSKRHRKKREARALRESRRESKALASKNYQHMSKLFPSMADASTSESGGPTTGSPHVQND